MYVSMNVGLCVHVCTCKLHVCTLGEASFLMYLEVEGYSPLARLPNVPCRHSHAEQAATAAQYWALCPELTPFLTPHPHTLHTHKRTHQLALLIESNRPSVVRLECWLWEISPQQRPKMNEEERCVSWIHIWFDVDLILKPSLRNPENSTESL